MRRSGTRSALRIISMAFLLFAVILTAVMLIRFSRVRSYLPAGLMVAGVPVGGLDRAEAAARLQETYSVPVNVRYKDSIIQLDPAVVDFQLNIDKMLADADLQRTEQVFWQEFWDYLWGRTSSPGSVPLSASYSEQRLRIFLQEIATRYDQPSQAALPFPGSVTFQPGEAGTSLQEDGAVRLIENALYSTASRAIDLPLQRTNPTRPPFNYLDTLLRQTLQVEGFEGIAGIYLLDLQTGEEIHFAWRNGDDLPVEPDVAFTASSIIKIPIMVSAFTRMNDMNDAEALKLMSDMIDLSGNEAADWLMDRVIDPENGPLKVTDDMRTLGLDNTFLAGYFSAGSPILELIDTPANTRQDVDTDPDIYSQTTPSDIGMLLHDIYDCAQTGGGTLPAAFPGLITQDECRSMNTLLLNNRLPVLLTAGLPEGTQIAHKHGWVTYNGVIETIGDAGIVYTLGGNYAVAIFLNNTDQLLWESNSELVAKLSQAIFNYYNLPAQ
jgi:beta-lactamase class A